MGRPEPTCGSMSGWAMLSTSARRAEASFCSPESGRWCCSARESGRRRFWRCCTRWRRPARRGRSCGCTRLAIGSIIPSPPKSAASCPRSPHGRSYVCYSRPGSRDRMGEDFDATGHLSRSVFDEVGIPREADVYLCGPDSLHGRHERGARGLRRRAGADSRRNLQRRRVDDSRCRRRSDASSASAQGRRRHRSAGVVRAQWHRRTLEARRPTRASWSWPRRATSRSAGRAGPVFVTTARAVWFRARSSTDRSHSTSPPTATFSFAARNRFGDVVIDL